MLLGLDGEKPENTQNLETQYMRKCCVFGKIIDEIAHLCYDICATLHIYSGVYAIRFIVQ